MTVFLPCRAGSERVPNKNTKPFCGLKGGLIALKLKELLKSNKIERILLSTNDPAILDAAKHIKSSKIEIDIRPEHLASSSTSTDDLIDYVSQITNDEHVLWTHVTSPFINYQIYDCAIDTYFEQLKNGFDSLMTVNKIHAFLWTEKGSLNYDRSIEKWPRTQTLPKVYEVNSGIFINSLENYKNFNDRIGNKPYLFETEGHTSFDIDWPEDFEMAELIYKTKILKK